MEIEDESQALLVRPGGTRPRLRGRGPVGWACRTLDYKERDSLFIWWGKLSKSFLLSRSGASRSLYHDPGWQKLAWSGLPAYRIGDHRMTLTHWSKPLLRPPIWHSSWIRSRSTLRKPRNQEGANHRMPTSKQSLIDQHTTNTGYSFPSPSSCTTLLILVPPRR